MFSLLYRCFFVSFLFLLSLTIVNAQEQNKAASPAVAGSVKIDNITAEPSGIFEPGPLGDRIIGSSEAPVTIVEYASLTCSHCANFHAKTLPALKEKYIDKGKIRLIFREFPLDPLSTAASMLARCAPEQRYFPLVSIFFEKQLEWATAEKPLDELLNIARQAGFTKESFEACLQDKAIYEGLNVVKKRATDIFKVDSTPTFFIGKEKKKGYVSIEELDKIIEPLLIQNK